MTKRQLHMRYISWVSLVSLCASSGMSNSLAADYSAVGQASYISTDNVGQTPIGRSSGVYELNALLGIQQQTGRLQADGEADLTYRIFDAKGLDNDFIPRFRGVLGYELLSDRLLLIAEDNLGQIALSPVEGLLPTDRESVNVISVGPDAVLLRGATRRLRGSLRYVGVDYETTDLDSRRVTGQIGVDTDFSIGAVGSLVAFAAKNRFSSSAYEEYKTYGVALGLQGENRRTSLALSVGSGFAEQRGDHSSSFYLDLLARRHISDRLDLSITAVSRYGDSADVFLSTQNFQESLHGNLGLDLGGGLLLQQMLGLSVRYAGARLGFGLAGNWSVDDPVESGVPNRNVHDVLGSIDYALSTGFSAGLFGRLATYDSGATLAHARYESYGGYVRWRASSDLTLEARAEQNSRSKSERNFDENRVMLTIRWNVANTRPPLRSIDSWEVRRRRVANH